MKTWVQLLPSPGPMVGTRLTFTIAADVPEQVIEHTQLPMPVNIDFNQASELVGWIRELRLNEDRSVDGLLEWTDVGLDYLRTQGGGYVAPGVLLHPYGSEKTRIIDAAVTQNPLDPRRMRRVPVMPVDMLRDELHLLVKQTAHRLGVSEDGIFDRVRAWTEQHLPE